jgi:hypothetical protein
MKGREWQTQPTCQEQQLRKRRVLIEGICPAETKSAQELWQASVGRAHMDARPCTTSWGEAFQPRLINEKYTCTRESPLGQPSHSAAWFLFSTLFS